MCKNNRKQESTNINKMVEILYQMEETKDILMSMEQSFTLTLQHLQANYQNEISSLSERHSREMERASIGEQGKRIAILVEKHVEEMDELEKMLLKEISDAKSRQRLEYNAFVLDLYNNREKYISEGYKPKKTTLTNSRQSTPKQSPVPSRKGYSLSSIFKKSTKDVEEEPVIPVEQKRSHTFIVLLGSQLKMPVQISIQASSILSLCSAKSDRDDIEPVYGNSLKSCVMMVDTNLTSFSQEHIEFIKQCNQTTELQFDDVELQLDNIKKQVGDELAVGDFFVTTHSNLKKVHVVFHLAVGKKHDSVATEKLLAGLFNIIKISNRYDIESISFPVLLIQNELKHVLRDEDCISRVDAVVTALKVFLIENTSNNTLKHISFVVPHEANDTSIYEHTKRKVAQAFNLQ